MNRRKNPESDNTRRNYKENIMDKAKRLLMSRFSFTEPEAHKYIQKCAMDSGTGITETCEMLILLYDAGD